MPQASVKRLIEVEKENLIDLVLDIDKYPSFIPYCINSKVYKREDKGENIFIIADLTIGKGIFKDTYKSDVRFSKKNDTIYVTNIDGPLKYLENKWSFNQRENVTEVIFDVDFELKNKFLNILMTKSFTYGLNKIADAFQKRSQDLFGNA
jgi:coenzyme Q-binding protein COQ10|tara:strand:+ start:764 stop:1213 length:450 start_codon:yes stop_codon:yes gene_type:complete